VKESPPRPGPGDEFNRLIIPIPQVIEQTVRFKAPPAKPITASIT